MLSALVAKNANAQNRRLNRKAISNRQQSLLLSKTKLQYEKQTTQLRSEFISSLIENEAKRNRLFDLNTDSIILEVIFSQKNKFTFRLPSTLTIFQLHQILSSYFKLHLKCSPSPNNAYAGIYVPVSFLQKKITPKIGKNNEINNLTVQILQFVYQNTLLSQKFTQIDEKQCISGIRTKQFQTLKDLISFKTKICYKQFQIQESSQEMNKNGENDQDNEQKNVNKTLKLMVRYNMVNELDNRCEKISNTVKNQQKALYFSQNTVSAIKNKCLARGRELLRHYNSLEPSKNELSANQEIYIKEYTEGSEASDVQNESQETEIDCFSQDIDSNNKNLVTFDPKEILDSGRLRSENSSLHRLIKRFNHAQIVEYLLLKSLILQEPTHSQSKLGYERFMRFPVRFIGHQHSCGIYVFNSDKIQTNVFIAMNQLINKIISSDLCLSCQVFQSYSFKCNQLNPKNSQTQTVKAKVIKKTNFTKINAEKYQILLTEASPFNQAYLINYLQTILANKTLIQIEGQNGKSYGLNTQILKQFVKIIYFDVKKLLNQIIGFGGVFTNQQKTENTKQKKTEKAKQKHDKLSTSQIKFHRKILNIFETSQFWQIESQERHNFSKKANQPKISILSLFTCQRSNKNLSKTQLRINVFELVKRIFKFFQNKNKNELLQSQLQKADYNRKQFHKLLIKRLKSQFCFILKGFQFGLESVDTFMEFLQQNSYSKSQLLEHFFQKDKLSFIPDPSLVTLFRSTSSFLQKCASNKENFILEIQKKQKDEHKILSIHMKEHFSHYKLLMEGDFNKLRNFLQNSMQCGELHLHDCYHRSKPLYFSQGEALDIHEKETTLKKKKSSQSTSHKNSLDLHPKIFTSDFNYSQVFGKVNTRLQQNHIVCNRKGLDQKQNLRKSNSIKKEANILKGRNGKSKLKKDILKARKQ